MARHAQCSAIFHTDRNPHGQHFIT
jgi:hypothetical protein